MTRVLFALIAVAAAAASQNARAQGVWWTQPAPVIVHQPVHVVHSPVVVAPRVYHRPVVVQQRVPYVVTRHRPILGGSVSRVRYRYRTVAF